MRVAILPLLLSACSWFAGTPTDTTPGGATAEAVDLDPAAKLPKCLPADHKEERGATPFKVGQATPSGWTIAAVDDTNIEFVRVTWRKDGKDAVLEYAFNEAGEGEWSTKHYRLMPAPDQVPSDDLLQEAMAMLKQIQATQSGTPFVRRKQGVEDPYAGLPPCGPDGNPI